MVRTMQLPAGVRADYTTEFREVISEVVRAEAAPFAAAAERDGLNPDHVYESIQPVNRDREVVEGTIDDVPFRSTRVRTGMPGSGCANRGGFEWMADVEKAAKKGAIMTPKQRKMRTGDEGGKGGFWVPEQYRDRIKGDKAWRAKAIATHALMHDINGRDNPAATDIGTFPEDMNTMVEALLPYLGEEAYAAVSGADASHGGIPDFQLETTGLGAAIVLEEYLQARKEFGDSNDVIAEKLRNNIPLRVLVQALGKASIPFVRNLPKGTILAGAMEYAGGIYSPDEALDPDEIIGLAQRYRGLAEGSASQGQEWMPPDVKQIWRQHGDILVPAYDKDQVDESDIAETEAEITEEIANAGATTRARQKAHELEHDILSGILSNGGGTLGSSKRGNMLLYGAYRNVRQLKASWHSDMHRISRDTFREMYKMRQEFGSYVSPEDVIFRTVARQSVARRNTVRTGLVSMMG